MVLDLSVICKWHDGHLCVYTAHLVCVFFVVCDYWCVVKGLYCWVSRITRCLLGYYPSYFATLFSSFNVVFIVFVFDYFQLFYLGIVGVFVEF